SDVLIYAEQVCRIVAFLDLGQAVVALSISGANAIHTFIHHEIYVSTSRGIRVHCSPIVFRPAGDSFLVRRVRVDTNDDSGPVSVAVRPRRYAIPDGACFAVDRIEVHRRVHRRKHRAVLCMLGNRLMPQFPHKVSLPVPLQPWQIELVKHTLKRRVTNPTNQIKCWRFEFTDRLEHSLCLIEGSGVAPHDAAHFLVVQMLGEGRAGRNGKECEKAIKIIWRLAYEVSIPMQDFWRVFHRPQHWARVICVNGMCSEEKGRDNSKMAPASAHCPEEIGVLVGICGDKASVGENHVHSKEIIDGQTALPRKMANPAAKR